MKKQRIQFALLMAIVMVAMSPQKVWAQISQDSNGTYIIESADDLREFADIVNGTNGKTQNLSANAKLENDIYYVGQQERAKRFRAASAQIVSWTPIGNSKSHYKGTFDGQGHEITILINNYTEVNQGLFGYIENATIKNFTLRGTMTSSTQITSGENDCSGTVVGRAVGSSQILDVKSMIDWTITKAQKHLGGIVGAIEGSTIVAGCSYIGGTFDVGPSTDCIGGIVGFANASCSGSIKNCFFDSRITSTSSSPTIGGILGYTNDESKNFGGVQNCFCWGEISFGGTDYKYVNAIVGRIRARATTTINNTFCETATRACNTDGPSIPSSNKAITISVKADKNGSVNFYPEFPSSTTPTQLYVTASGNAHYHFSKWTDGGKNSHFVPLTDNVDLTAYFAIDKYTIEVVVDRDSEGMGTVSGSGTYSYKSKQTIVATPNAHYHFVKWEDGSTNAEREITVLNSLTCIAFFAPDMYTINALPKDILIGKVKGSGSYAYGVTQEITAIPDKGYGFKYWLEDKNTENPRQITVTRDATYTAVFDRLYTVTLSCNNSEYGTVSGAGEYLSGEYAKVSAIPNPGYRFVKWSTGSTAQNLTMSVDGNKNMTAIFEPNTYKIEIIVRDDKYGQVIGGGEYLYGTEVTLTAIPYDGAVFVKWDDNVTEASRKITVTQNAWYYAYFTPILTKAVYNNETLTFYRDAKEHDGQKYDLNQEPYLPGYFSQHSSKIATVVFEESFAAVHPSSCFDWFYNFKNLKEIIGIEYLNTDNVTNMEGMFNLCALESVDLSGFNTSKVTNMAGMFKQCALKSIDLSSFNTEQVKNMGGMFMGCSFESLDLSTFNTANVQNMSDMFSGCSSLKSLDLSSFNTASVKTMERIFNGCTNLQTLTLNNFHMPLEVDYDYQFLGNCSNLTTINFKSIPYLNKKTFYKFYTGDNKKVNYILDDNSVIYTGENYLPNNVGTITASYTREIKKDGGKYSFIVPFDIPADKAAEYGKFYKYSRYANGKVYFAEETEGVKANTAYFLDPATDISSIALSDAVIKADAPMADATSPTSAGLYGTYSQIAIPEGAYDYAADGNFVKVDTGDKLNPFRACLWLEGIDLSSVEPVWGDNVSLPGDINGDGIITIADLTLLIEILNGRAIDTTGNADVDGKNGVTIDDVEALRNIILGTQSSDEPDEDLDGYVLD